MLVSNLFVGVVSGVVFNKVNNWLFSIVVDV